MSSSITTLKRLTFVGAAAVGGMVALAKTTANVGDNFQKMALRTGASTEFLSTWAHVAELAGSNVATLETGIRLLSKRMLDADEGLAEAAGSFERMGINIHDAEGNLRLIEDIMPDVIEKLGSLTNETEKVALAQELFGRSGTQLLPLINQGTDAIKQQVEEAKALGLAWSQDAANAAADFNDEQTRIISGMKGVKNAVMISLIPTFTEWMKGATVSIKSFIKNDLPGFLERMKSKFHELWPRFKDFVKSLWSMGEFVIKHGDIIAKIFVGVTIVAVTAQLILLGVAIGGLALTPGGAVLAGLGLLAGLILLISNRADSAERSLRDMREEWQKAPIPETFGKEETSMGLNVTPIPDVSGLGSLVNAPDNQLYVPPIMNRPAPVKPTLPIAPVPDETIASYKTLEDAFAAAEEQFGSTEGAITSALAWAVKPQEELKTIPLIKQQFEDLEDSMRGPSFEFILMMTMMEQAAHSFASSFGAEMVRILYYGETGFDKMLKAWRDMLTQMMMELAAKAAIFTFLNYISGGSFGMMTGGMRGFMGFSPAPSTSQYRAPATAAGSGAVGISPSMSSGPLVSMKIVFTTEQDPRDAERIAQVVERVIGRAINDNVRLRKM